MPDSIKDVVAVLMTAALEEMRDRCVRAAASGEAIHQPVDTIVRRWLVNFDVGKVSDGYHTFNELYAHRVALWIALCRAHGGAWRSKLHSDGEAYPGWFLLGLGEEPGKQMTYHLPDHRWDDTEFATTIDRAPSFDGHTSNDVLARVYELRRGNDEQRQLEMRVTKDWLCLRCLERHARGTACRDGIKPGLTPEPGSAPDPEAVRRALYRVKGLWAYDTTTVPTLAAAANAWLLACEQHEKIGSRWAEVERQYLITIRTQGERIEQLLKMCEARWSNAPVAQSDDRSGAFTRGFKAGRLAGVCESAPDIASTARRQGKVETLADCIEAARSWINEPGDQAEHVLEAIRETTTKELFEEACAVVDARTPPKRG